jgi:hypothetical protein
MLVSEFSAKREEIDPERLIEVTEAVLVAIRDVEEHTGGPCPHPAQLMGSSLQPDSLSEFTKYEVAEACAFLERLGVMKTTAK